MIPRFSGTAVLDPSVVQKRKFSAAGQEVYARLREVLKSHEGYLSSLPDFVKVEVVAKDLPSGDYGAGTLKGIIQDSVTLSYQSDYGLPVQETFLFPVTLTGQQARQQLVEKRSNNPQAIGEWLDGLFRKDFQERAKLFLWNQKPEGKEI